VRARAYFQPNNLSCDSIQRDIPRLATPPPSLIQFLSETPLQTCTASGFPQAALYWLKDGQPLRTGARVRTISSERISVTSVAREDRGMYQCFVRNEYEMAQGIAELRLGGEYSWQAFARGKHRMLCVAQQRSRRRRDESGGVDGNCGVTRGERKRASVSIILELNRHYREITVVPPRLLAC